MTITSNDEATSLLGMYRAAPEHPDEVVLPIIGSVPQELRGTLYRNGPADWESGGFNGVHPFDGDGLVVKFTITGGTVKFRSRYVDTPKRRKELRGAGDRIRGVYTQARRLRDNIGRGPADAANTHAVVHADRLLALSDAGRPWQLDLDDLSTLGPCTFNGQLPSLSRFSPHPRIDPVTGELFNFGLDVGPSLEGRTVACLRCFRVDPAGRLSQLAAIPLEHIYIQHDFAITPQFLVFALAPITVDPVTAALAALGKGALGDSADYRPQQGMKIILVPRAGGGKPRIIECDPFVYIHVDNAYEDRGDVVLDLVRHESFAFLSQAAKQFRTEPLAVAGWPARLRVSAGGSVDLTDYPSPATEFPSHDERRTGREHRYTYLASAEEDAAAIVKLDRQTNTQRLHHFSQAMAPGEPIFVPKAHHSGEDEGWLLVVTYNAGEHRTELHILDAADIENPPLAIAVLPSHHFPGFHGSFTERITAP
ncbi:carotenoid oxygenase family protein [Mycolicibacterium sp. lyk4-40-TYG-92]|uniref:carotenoid oxygenase family protein n=1 Tax=Mycolicibacterium sp. lyk4-40-TYG-92 TaxID=3040295 RepID=UPI00254E82F1|nr:carotenoid oxygenase family protein [Mycolicibacterium sp. lyk4-40-TYG-92]